MEESRQVERKRGAFQRQRIMSMYVEVRKSENNLATTVEAP